MRDLVLVHGRSQQRRDSIKLKAAWIEDWERGLKKLGLERPIADEQIHFPYYGDTLDQLVAGKSPEEAAQIVVRGNQPDDDSAPLSDDEKAFIEAALMEQIGLYAANPDLAVQQELPPGTPIEKGVLNWGWVQGILTVLDRHVPGASGASVALATRDVYQYLTRKNVRDIIDNGVASAMDKAAGRKTVVVAHSLGTVVAYNVLRNLGQTKGWSVPLFVTVGSPLAITVIKQRLAQISPMVYPGCVGGWYNAMDERDVVALNPLDETNFRLKPKIENKTNVDNHTENRHGIDGYLDDPDVAKKIYDAVVQGD